MRSVVGGGGMAGHRDNFRRHGGYVMADIQKVIKGLHDAEITLRGFANHFPPLRDECHEQADACYDALELLKKQSEEVKPFHKCVLSDSYTMIEDSHFDYCPYCGRKVNPDA